MERAKRNKATEEMRDKDLGLELEPKIVLAEEAQDKCPHEAGSKLNSSTEASHLCRRPEVSTNDSL